ncbi:hypothetical protein RU820_04800 [Acidithiobacillus ferrooxidans]|uniref:Uncharacterized protein n=1 Tax=Acidithiobacillus ferrooxidans (strain ATCC 23270 / DSM 14882 / CIP 104768 / NCIMB 8455) TaxID=243159 RepID=B7J7I1_ACIF2|nr:MULTISPECIES: hypothetical protein [Acidithiobacillus]ACK78859.1 hypothetical protein AFE_1006 [Acidithiobacillus ferrooxidans ATCC 23270]MBN6745461.1 hypothetical protein [Acidithiobacillus sp. MC2.2]MBN6746885.1 hypothetical protein [Acidithiobacillus sp. PG05]
MLVDQRINTSMVRNILSKRFGIPVSAIRFDFDEFRETLNFKLKWKKNRFEGFIVSKMSKVAIKAAFGYELIIYPDGRYNPCENTTISEFAKIDLETMPIYLLARHVSNTIARGVVAILKATLAGESECLEDGVQEAMDREEQLAIDRMLFDEYGISQHPNLPNRDLL